MTGDFDGNGRVGFSDFFLFADAFGSTDPLFDLDNDGRIGFNDFFLFADQFGTETRAKLLNLAHRYLELPASSQLGQSYPNPFNASTTIQYQLAQTGTVRLEVYHVMGQKVRTLVHQVQAQGAYQITWHGEDEQDRHVSSGSYFIRLQTDHIIQVKKVLFMN